MKKFSDIMTKNELRFPDFFFFNKELNYNKFWGLGSKITQYSDKLLK